MTGQIGGNQCNAVNVAVLRGAAGVPSATLALVVSYAGSSG